MSNPRKGIAKAGCGFWDGSRVTAREGRYRYEEGLFHRTRILEHGPRAAGAYTLSAHFPTRAWPGHHPSHAGADDSVLSMASTWRRFRRRAWWLVAAPTKRWERWPLSCLLRTRPRR